MRVRRCFTVTVYFELVEPSGPSSDRGGEEGRGGGAGRSGGAAAIGRGRRRRIEGEGAGK